MPGWETALWPGQTVEFYGPEAGLQFGARTGSVMRWTEPATEIVDREVYDHAVQHMKAARVVLPTFAELAEPNRIAAPIGAELDGVDFDAPVPANLFRVHWYNDRGRNRPGAV